MNSPSVWVLISRDEGWLWTIMSISLIAAIAANNCIGKNNSLPWRIPEDMKRYKEITMGKVIIMGRKTWESIPEKFRPLPGRKNVIITRQAEYPVPSGVELYSDIPAAFTAHKEEEVIINGGAEIYRQTIGLADTLYITHVNQPVDGDAFFPEIDKAKWQETKREDHDGFSFVVYQRKNK